MKAIFQNRTNWLLIVSPVLVALGLIFSYGAIAKTKSGETREAAGRGLPSGPTADPTPCEHSDFAENAEAAREYRNAFGVNGNLAPDVYAKAVAAARALPPSPFLKGRTFMPQTPNPPWRSLPPPINTNNGDYGFSASPRVQALAVDPSNPNVVYTGSWGGLAKSNNANPMLGEVNWEYLSDSWNSQAVSSIAIDPNAPASVFVGTGVDDLAFGAGLYRSADGGAHWDNIGVSEFGQTIIRTIAIDPRPSDSSLAPGTMAPIIPQTTLFVANGFGPNENGGLWRSTDSGSNWTRLSDPTLLGAYDIAIDPSTRPSTVYVSLPSGVYRVVRDSQKNWERIYVANWADPKIGKLSVVDSVLYLLDPSDNQLRKLDTQCPNCDWSEIPTLCTNTEMHCAAGQPLAPNLFAVDPTNPATILIDQSFQSTGHGPNRLFRTVDGGSHWTEVGRCTIHVDQRAFAFSSDNSGVVYEGNDGGVVRSADHGETWHNLNDHFPGALTFGVALSRDDSIIGGTQDCGVLFSDPGAPWDMIQGGDSSQNLIDPWNPNISYYTTLGSKEFTRYNRSANSSTNINPTNPSFGTEPCGPTFTMNPLAPGHLVAACQRVMRTLDATATPVVWTKVGSGALTTADNQIVSAACEAPSDLYVLYAVVARLGKPGSQVFVKRYGVDWMLLPNATQQEDVNAIAVDPTLPGTVYLAKTSGVYRSADFGASWSPVMGVPANLNYTALTIDPANPELIFAASNGGIFASFHGVNATWDEISAGIPEGMHIFALSFNQFSRQLAAATFGRGVYLLDLDDVSPTMVSITSPAGGDTVFETVTISAVASDNHRVAGVQFKIDGENFGDEDTSVPYAIRWDTIGWGGTHILTAVARDPANNTTTSAGVKVTVSEEKP